MTKVQNAPVRSQSLNTHPQLLTVPEASSQHGSRRSSYASTTSSHQERYGGLRRRRISQMKVATLRNSQLKPMEKLKRFLRSVKIIVEVCLALRRYVKNRKRKESRSLQQMQLDLQDEFNRRLTFNPRYYSSSYVANKGSNKLKKLLAISPPARTKRHVRMIHTLVQNKPAFSKHPAHIRLKMCQVMIYQSYGPRRIIIKQGHPPSAFYILLSGTCLINAREVDARGSESTQTVNELREGEVFGEVALLNKTTRTASVVCKGDVELLVIYREDFDAIIRGPIYKQREEVIEFCKNVPILSDWPVHLLSSASIVNFHFQYYKHGHVVIRNNWKSSFLVFIKSGECRVVCTLDGGDEQMHAKSLHVRHKSVAMRTAFPLLDDVAKNIAIKSRSRSLHPRANISLDNRYVDSALSRSRLPTIYDESASLESARQNATKAADVQMFRRLRLTTRSVQEHIDAFENVRQRGDAASLNDKAKRSFLSVPRSSIVPLRSTRRSIIDDTPYTIAKNKKPSDLTKSSSDEPEQASRPRFAQIAVLKTGCVFGLEEMTKRTELQLSLLSDGAECVFVSKKMFQKHATPLTLRCLQAMVGRYPTEAYIRHQLEEQSQWSEFRREVVDEVLNRRSKKVEGGASAALSCPK